MTASDMRANLMEVFSQAIGKSGKDDSVLRLVSRDGNTMFLAV